jgi:type IV secretory pathway TrbF-like protein
MATAPRLVHYEDDLLRKQNARWQLISLIACGGLCLALVALLVLVHQPRTRPYVVMVDTRGEPLGMVQPLAGNPVAAQDTITKWTIEQFIRNAKTATPDIPQQKEHLFDAYAFVKLQAHDELDAYYHDPEDDRNPFDIAKKSWIQVSNIRVLKLPASGTFQADWDETRTDYNTTVSRLTKWRATTKILNDEATDRNPLGIYIETLDWAQEQSE